MVDTLVFMEAAWSSSRGLWIYGHSIIRYEHVCMHGGMSCGKEGIER